MPKYEIANPRGGESLIIDSGETDLNESQLNEIRHKEFFSPEATEALVKTKEPEAGKIPMSARATGMGLAKYGTLENYLLDKYLKENPSLSEKVQAGAEGALGSATFGASDVARTRVFGAPYQSEEDPQQRQKLAAFGGRIAGGFVTPVPGVGPAAGVLKSGSALAKIGKAGVVGAGIGGVSGAVSAYEDPSKTLSEATEEVPKEALEGAAIGGASGLVLGTGGVAIQKGLKAIAGRAPNSILARWLDIPKTDVAGRENVVEGNYSEFFPEIKSNAPSTEKGVNDFMEGISNSLSKRADKFAPVIQQTNQQLFDKAVNRKTAVDFIRNALKSEINNPEEIEKAIEKLIPEIEDLNQKNILDKSRVLNKELSKYYRNPQSIQPAEAAAKEALRDFQSDAIKNLLEYQGVNPSQYSEYGMLNDLLKKTRNTFRDVQFYGEKAAGTPVLERFVEGASSGYGGKGGAVKGAYKMLKPSDVESMHSDFSKILKKTKQAAPDLSNFTPQEKSPFEGLPKTEAEAIERMRLADELQKVQNQQAFPREKAIFDEEVRRLQNIQKIKDALKKKDIMEQSAKELIPQEQFSPKTLGLEEEQLIYNKDIQRIIKAFRARKELLDQMAIESNR